MPGGFFAVAAGGASLADGRTLPVEAGSYSAVVACGVSGFDWNRSPSLVEVSQPLSHNRHATVATMTRPAVAPIGASPRGQAPAYARPGGSTRRSGVAVTTNR